MKEQIVVKGISYSFEQNDTYDKVKEIAVERAKDLFEDEAELQKDEYAEYLEEKKADMQAAGQSITGLTDEQILPYSEYCDEAGIIPNGVDYTKSFEENFNTYAIQAQIEELTNKFMCNVHDLPQNVVIEIDDSLLDEKGKPSDTTIRQAIQEKFGNEVNVASYNEESVGKADKKDILSQQAYEKIGNMIDSKDFQSFLDLRASIEKYSSKNIALIYLQKPDAKAVMGGNAWKAYDRHITKDEKALSIWQPCKRELKTEKQVDNYIKANEYEYGKPDSPKAIKAKKDFMAEIEDKGKTEVMTGYILGSTFDISQTTPFDKEHDNLDQIINLNKPLDMDLANYDEIVKSMKVAAELAPFSIPQAESQQDALYNAVKNYADVLLRESPEKVNGIKSRIAMQGDMHKIETAMTTHLICSHIGIECGDKVSLELAEIFNKDNLSKEMVTNGKRDMFITSFDRACKVTDQFTKSFDKDFGYSIEAQREAVKQAVAEKKAQFEAEQKALSANRTYFGSSPAQKIDEWVKDGTTFTVGQIEKTGKYCVKAVGDDKKTNYLRDDDGKPMKFDVQPSRESVENTYSPAPPKEKETKKEVKKAKSKDTVTLD